MANNNKNILVTGAAGLIGREVCDQLVNLGHAVTAVDNGQRFSNVIPAGDFIKTDLDVYLKSAENNFDYIYHLAAINGTKSFYSNPNGVLYNNTKTDLEIFKFAESNTDSKLIYASSSEVIAGTDKIPSPELVEISIENIHNPRWSYRLPKILSENYLVNSSINYVIIRYFNVYSEYSGAGHFVKDLIDKLMNGNYDLQSPHETRSFCYVTDAVRATIKLSETVDKEIINVGSSEELTVLDAANIIADELGIKAQWNYTPSLQGSVSRRQPDISKLLKYYPEFIASDFRSTIRSIKDKIL